MNQDADIDLILGDCDDSFKAGDVEQPCLITLQDEIFGASDQYPGQVMAMAYALVRTTAFPELKEQDPVSVKRFDELAFTDYRAARILRIQDGRITQVFLGAV
jgi:hypothetical protein